MASPRLPHVLLVSAPLQGHLNPLLVLGRRLASKGLLITFSTVPHAGLKFKHGDGVCIKIGRGALRFEHLCGGDLWTPDDPRYDDNTLDVMSHLDNTASPALEELIHRQADAGRPLTCVVANTFAPWALRVASGLGIPHAVLWTESCAVLSLYYHYFHSLADFPPAEAGQNAQVAVPGLPPLATSDLPSLIHAPEQFIWRQLLVADLRGLRETVSWVLVNTFDELEHATIEALGAHLPIVPLGPLFDPDINGRHDASVGAWLDEQLPRSVVFVAFGSLLKISCDEVAELAAGLAATGRPFLWVVRDDNRELLLDDYLAPVASSKGKVVAWCEQGQVLCHHAVGCFVTHCGWNSTIEALATGVPVVAYPGYADQPTNAKFLTDVYGMGVRLPRPMAREALRRCVEEVMSGPEAGARQERSSQWKAEASTSLADGGSSDKATQHFVDVVLAI